MSDRTREITAFFKKSPWSNWQSQQIPADASARSYIRLIPPPNQTDATPVIVMNAPPETGENTIPFAKITALLCANGLAAPTILHHDASLGIMVLHDLGLNDFAKWITNTPSDCEMLYMVAADVLSEIAKISPPSDLPIMDTIAGGKMVEITAQWYAPDVNATQLCACMQDHLERLAPEPTVLALRDFHAENLIWRPDLQGLNRVGLLDYQDAFIAPTGYDLASLLRDARRDVPAKVVNAVISHFTTSNNLDPDLFRSQFACLSVQRNLRILGVFARLIRRDNKHKYLQFMPRVWSHIQTDLAHPSLTELRATTLAILPEPNASTIKDLL